MGEMKRDDIQLKQGTVTISQDSYDKLIRYADECFQLLVYRKSTLNDLEHIEEREMISKTTKEIIKTLADLGVESYAE